MNNQSLGFMYIAEQVSPLDNKPSNMTIHDEHGAFYVEFDTILQTFMDINRNRRRYISENVQRCINTDERIQSYLADNGWYGEQDHPAAEFQDKKLTPERIQNIKMDNTSHKILNPTFTGDVLKARIQTDSGCAAGINMTKKIIQGLIPGFSCRAFASINLKDNIPTVDVKRVITYDWVLYPSHKRAHSISPNKYVNKTVNVINESVSEDVCVPLKEILEYAGEKNVTSQIIMESFELNNDSLVGFSKDANHIIVKDKDNMIYCNMDLKLKREVSSYLSNL